MSQMHICERSQGARGILVWIEANTSAKSSGIDAYDACNAEKISQNRW